MIKKNLFKLAITAATVSLLVLPATSKAASITNVALNKTAILTGTFFTGDQFWSNDGIITHPQTVVDGIFVGKGKQWNEGSVWWSKYNDYGQQYPPWFSFTPYINIDLGEFFNIESFVIEADNNDMYKIEYKGINGMWQTAWDVPKNAVDSAMTTRPNANDVTQRYMLASPIMADALRVTNYSYNDAHGDGYYAVSEIQAFGTPTPAPEPASAILGLLGIGGILGAKRRK